MSGLVQYERLILQKEIHFVDVIYRRTNGIYNEKTRKGKLLRKFKH